MYRGPNKSDYHFEVYFRYRKLRLLSTCGVIMLVVMEPPTMHSCIETSRVCSLGASLLRWPWSLVNLPQGNQTIKQSIIQSISIPVYIRIINSYTYLHIYIYICIFTFLCAMPGSLGYLINTGTASVSCRWQVSKMLTVFAGAFHREGKRSPKLTIEAD